jgi:hypothetical protein
MLRKGRFLLCAFALCQSAALHGQDPKQIVRLAVQTELAADRDDHSHWIYFETDSRPDRTVKQWVAETRNGNVRRVVELNGKKLPKSEQRSRMQNFLQNSDERSKQKKGEQHDDQQAAEMLQMLPNAFIWTDQGRKGDSIILHFKPDPQFNPPDMEAKVFAAMEGDMAVDAKQHRIVSLKGKLTHDVKILGGFLGALNAGGTFDVERRQTGGSVWQITETHVHIDGHVLIFKSISEQEDDVKTEFKQLPEDISLEQAENDLLAQARD